jgi:hypothetical protein
VPGLEPAREPPMVSLSSSPPFRSRTDLHRDRKNADGEVEQTVRDDGRHTDRTTSHRQAPDCMLAHMP